MDNGVSSYRRFLSGDKDGLVDIIRTHRDGLTLYIFSIVGNMDIAEEIMEDTFVKIYVKKPKYSEKSSFKTWLYSIGKHTATDYIRKKTRISIISYDSIIDISNEENMEHSFVKSEDNITLHKAMQRLKPDYEQVLYLVFFEQFSSDETAKVMNKTNRQIRNLLYNAKKALKAELEKEGFVYENL
jgi:RNA polymerase sigma-70 factor (ECF subfamily)